MSTSDALDLEPGVFTKRSARAIAESLRRSAERSRRRKSAPFRSAMSMLTFHINRGGKGLPESQRRVLERAKVELRRLYGKSPEGAKTTASRSLRPARKARPGEAARKQRARKRVRATP